MEHEPRRRARYDGAGLGHKNPTLTANMYTYLMRERFEEGREKLEK